MKRLCQRLCLVGLILWLPMLAGAGSGQGLVVGSKKFTESVILGELLRLTIASTGRAADHRGQLGGSRVLFSALESGEIDAYPEYTGTLLHELLASEGLSDLADLREALARRGLAMLEPLGFNNSYAIGMLEDKAAELGIRTVSDLARHPALVLAFSHEFIDRADGWQGLQQRYGLPQASPQGLDHDLAYRAIAAGRIGATDIYTTDAEIGYYGLRTLIDDRDYFRDYRAVVLYRAELERTAPEVIARLGELSGRIDEASMIAMNARVKITGETEAEVAAGFLDEALSITVRPAQSSKLEELTQRTLEHLTLVGISLSAAIIIGLPLGIAAARIRFVESAILSTVSIVQTIPSLALFVFMIPLLGIGAAPAIAALFLYSLLPIVRNVHTGLRDISQPVHEAAVALGLPGPMRLLQIELPLCTRTILAGIKTSAVINVGTATLAALIGAGGYGQPILTGIRLDDMATILMGAIPAALLALAVQALFGLIEKGLLPRGLRLAQSSIDHQRTGQTSNL
jgi:osmoprotectant transport system permease protein